LTLLKNSPRELAGLPFSNARGLCVKQSREGAKLRAPWTWIVSSIALLSALVLFEPTSTKAQVSLDSPKRPVSVSDSVQMTRLSDSDYALGLTSEGRVAKFSPNGQRFIIVLRKGNLKHNTNEYSLLLFQSSEVFRKPNPEVLLTMSSSSNREAIQNVKWFPDNDTIAFLGENPGEVPDLYSFNVRTKSLSKLTNHPTPIVRYDISNQGDVMIFEAEPPIRASVDTEETRRNGLVLSTQNLLDPLTGDRYPPFATEGEGLFVKVAGNPTRRVPVEDHIDHQMPISLSPSGRYGVFEVFVRDVPPSWEGYRDRSVSSLAAEKRPKGTWINLLRYMLLDTETGEVTPLLNAPAESRIGVTWAEDGTSVLVSGARLPIDVPDPQELEERKNNVYVVEVSVPSGQVRKVRHWSDTYRLFQCTWQSATRILLDEVNAQENPVRAAYERDGTRWKEVPIGQEDGRKPTSLHVVLEEGMNTPPKVYVSDGQGKGKALLMDLNPHFGEIDFGKVERVTWDSTDGHEFWGGLFWPPDFTPGKRYPLVIQTHGFNPKAFSMDGFYNPASAARALASRGFLVLQVNGFNKVYPGYGEGPQEAPVQMSAFEGAVDWLDKRGVIDRGRVGLVGFSRTVYYVAFTLTHSKYHFAAAIMADGINAGYFQYISNGGSLMAVFDRLNGGVPWGKTADRWLKNSPGFNLDKVDTPVRLETHGYSGDAPSEWEWFVGLSHLNKPVELIYLPDAAHILVKPWEKIVSQQGAVDWFCFWLKREEDSDPAKRDQYERWHKLSRDDGANSRPQDKDD
jgi:hypothetical protein